MGWWRDRDTAPQLRASAEAEFASQNPHRQIITAHSSSCRGSDALSKGTHISVCSTYTHTHTQLSLLDAVCMGYQRRSSLSRRTDCQSHWLSVALHLEIRPQEMSSITHWHSHRCCCCAGNRLGEISLLQQLSVLSRRHCLTAG